LRTRFVIHNSYGLRLLVSPKSKGAESTHHSPLTTHKNYCSTATTPRASLPPLFSTYFCPFTSW
jgi:hypothetical protein